jgi:hypothetical protein
MANDADLGIFLIENWWLLIIIGIIVVALIIIIRRNKDQGLKEFKPQPLKKTLDDEIKAKTNLLGRDFKGKVYIGFDKKADIDKYYYIRGFFDLVKMDYKTREVVLGKKDDRVLYDLIVMRALSASFIKRILGLGKFYLVLKMKDQNKEGKERIVVRFDAVNKAVFLDIGTDLTSYGKIWTNCFEGIEYLQDVSIKRLLEQTQMHLENIPDKNAHIEMLQATKERSKRVDAEIEKGKYQDRKEASDTTIT